VLEIAQAAFAAAGMIGIIGGVVWVISEQ